MICVNCGHQQETGNFCGKCGAKLNETSGQTNESIVDIESAATNPQPNQQTAPPVEPAEPNVYVENVKEKSKLYFQYFMQYLKNPAHVYKRGEAEFPNGLTSIIILGVLLGLSFFTLINNGGFYDPSFFSVFGGILFFSFVSMGLVIVALLLINNFFGPQHSFKSIVSLYGGHLSPILLIAAASLLLMLLKSYTFGSLALVIIFMFLISLLPLYLISVLLTKKSSGLDPFYGYVLYIVTFSILFGIFTVILADSTIGGFIDEFYYYF